MLHTATMPDAHAVDLLSFAFRVMVNVAVLSIVTNKPHSCLETFGGTVHFLQREREREREREKQTQTGRHHKYTGESPVGTNSN